MAEHSYLLSEDKNGSPAHGQSVKAHGKGSAGRPSMESYMSGDKPSFIDDSLIAHYRERCSRLEGELHDSDRKIRLQVDEIMQLKRELSQDRTETLLSHQKEISELKEAHRNDIERLKEAHRREAKDFEKQIGDLEKQAFKMELEQRTGDRTTGNRILDMLEEMAPSFIEHVSGFMTGPAAAQPGGPAATPPRQLSPEQAEQLRQAFEQDMAGVATFDAGPGENSHPEPPTRRQADPISGGEQPPSAHRPSATDGQSEQTSLNEQFSGQKNGHQKPTMKL